MKLANRMTTEQVDKLERLMNDYNHFKQTTSDKTNHAFYRMFRCYLDGSYTNHEHYRKNVNNAKTLSYEEAKKYVREQWKSYIIADYCIDDHPQAEDFTISFAYDTFENDEFIQSEAMEDFYELATH